MKNILFSGILLFAFALSCSAQKMPPAAVIVAFQQQFPKTRVEKWNLEKDQSWEAQFEVDGKDMSASFSPAAQWLETETEIEPSELPAAVQKALEGKKVKEAAKIQRADGSTVYEAEVGRKDMLFDASGKLVSEDAEKD